MGVSPFEGLLGALAFAARKHRDQRRKGVEASPYINHPIDVAHELVRVGRVKDPITLIAAVLHDTIEDTRTRGEEIEALFGPEVRRAVEEVTDDTSLPRAERKRRQVERAPGLSRRARLIKLGDKICNVRDVLSAPPAGWDEARRREYLDWTESVVAGIRGTDEALETEYDRVLAQARRVLGGGAPLEGEAGGH